MTYGIFRAGKRVETWRYDTWLCKWYRAWRGRESRDARTPCPECKGAGIEFKGLGLDTQYKICSAYKSTDAPDGHPHMTDIQTKYRDRVRALRPSGRFA